MTVYSTCWDNNRMFWLAETLLPRKVVSFLALICKRSCFFDAFRNIPAISRWGQRDMGFLRLQLTAATIKWSWYWNREFINNVHDPRDWTLFNTDKLPDISFNQICCTGQECELIDKEPLQWFSASLVTETCQGMQVRTIGLIKSFLLPIFSISFPIMPSLLQFIAFFGSFRLNKMKVMHIWT